MPFPHRTRIQRMSPQRLHVKLDGSLDFGGGVNDLNASRDQDGQEFQEEKDEASATPIIINKLNNTLTSNAHAKAMDVPAARSSEYCTRKLRFSKNQRPAGDMETAWGVAHKSTRCCIESMAGQHRDAARLHRFQTIRHKDGRRSDRHSWP